MSRSITITIINEASEDRPSPDLGSQDSEKKKPSADNEKSKKTVGDLLKIYVGRRIYQSVKSTATTYMNKYFDASENYHAATAVDNVVSTIDGVVDLWSGAKGAAKGFAMIGASAAVGFGLGLTAVALTKTISAINQYASEAQNLVNSAYGNYFYGQRAGFVAGGHGTEN